jgi:hypothetical protein
MCDHEGKPCPGRSCRCVCDNCVLGDAEQEPERHPDAYEYGEPWGPDNPAPSSPWSKR